MELDEWLAALSAELGTTDLVMDNNAIHTLLDLARDSAHEVERVAAPLTTYLVGVAVGRGMPLGAVAATATALAMNREAPLSAPEDPLPEG
jgi:glutamate-1-semialdehyde aminotransferase